MPRPSTCLVAVPRPLLRLVTCPWVWPAALPTFSVSRATPPILDAICSKAAGDMPSKPPRNCLRMASPAWPAAVVILLSSRAPATPASRAAGATLPNSRVSPETSPVSKVLISPMMPISAPPRRLAVSPPAPRPHRTPHPLAPHCQLNPAPLPRSSRRGSGAPWPRRSELPTTPTVRRAGPYAAGFYLTTRRNTGLLVLRRLRFGLGVFWFGPCRAEPAYTPRHLHQHGQPGKVTTVVCVNQVYRTVEREILLLAAQCSPQKHLQCPHTAELPCGSGS